MEAAERIAETLPQIVIGHVVIARVEPDGHLDLSQPPRRGSIFGVLGPLCQVTSDHQCIGLLLRNSARDRIERGAILHSEVNIADMKQACGHNGPRSSRIRTNAQDQTARIVPPVHILRVKINQAESALSALYPP